MPKPGKILMGVIYVYFYNQPTEALQLCNSCVVNKPKTKDYRVKELPT